MIFELVGGILVGGSSLNYSNKLELRILALEKLSHVMKH